MPSGVPSGNTNIALGGTPAHGNVAGPPVNVGIVFLQPGMTDDDFLPTEVADRKYRALSVVLESHNQVDLFLDRTAIIKSTVNVVDRDGSG